MLALTAGQQAFPDGVIGRGAIDTSALDVDGEIQARIALMPMLHWKAENVRKRVGNEAGLNAPGSSAPRRIAVATPVASPDVVEALTRLGPEAHAAHSGADGAAQGGRETITGRMRWRNPDGCAR